MGDVIVIKGDERNKGKWKIGIIERLYPERGGIVRAVTVRCGNNQIERAVQHLYPLELQCDMSEKSQYTDESKSNEELDINTRKNPN